MKRSDIYEYILGNSRTRILIISATAYNPRKTSYLRILPASDPASPALAVPLASPDPGDGTIDITRIRPLDPNSLGPRIGRLTPATMTRVDQALRLYLDL